MPRLSPRRTRAIYRPDHQFLKLERISTVRLFPRVIQNETQRAPYLTLGRTAASRVGKVSTDPIALRNHSAKPPLEKRNGQIFDEANSPTGFQSRYSGGSGPINRRACHLSAGSSGARLKPLAFIWASNRPVVNRPEDLCPPFTRVARVHGGSPVGFFAGAGCYSKTLIFRLRYHTGACALPWRPCKPSGPLRAKSFSATLNLFAVPSGFLPFSGQLLRSA